MRTLVALTRTERIYQEIGLRLRDALAEARQSQEELADRLDVSGSLVNQWVTGARRIQIEDLRRVAAILDKPVYWFLGEEPPGPDSVFAHDLHRLTPERREIAIGLIRTLREQQRREEKESG